MRGFFTILAVIGALAIGGGQASNAATYTVAQNSGLLKKMGCGSDPTNCTWCGKANKAGSNRCYNVTGCKDGKCSVVATMTKSPDPPKGPSQFKPASVAGSQPTTIKPSEHPALSTGTSGAGTRTIKQQDIGTMKR